MEVALALFFTGCYVLVFAIWRSMKLNSYSQLLSHFKDHFDFDKLNISDNAEYTECFSHRWVMKEIMTPHPSRLTGLFQDYVRENTLSASLAIGFILASSSMILVLILLGVVRALGFALPVFAIGMVLSLGSTSVNESEQLLNEVQSVFPSDIVVEDYPYVKIAYDTLRRWVMLSAAIGVGLLLISPFGEYVPTVMAYIVAQATRFVLWEPALFLLGYSVVLAILHLACGIVMISYLIVRILRVIVSSFAGIHKLAISEPIQDLLEQNTQEVENASQEGNE
ncbi:MAG: hypothetical protein ACOC3C_06625 [Candidatus Thorarchaeota archaeon]